MAPPFKFSMYSALAPHLGPQRHFHGKRVSSNCRPRTKSGYSFWLAWWLGGQLCPLPQADRLFRAQLTL